MSVNSRELIQEVKTGFGCGFNWSLQHLDSITVEEDVAHGIPDEDLL
jgi:hypothetical protein